MKKEYYGSTFIRTSELKEGKIKYPIELRYYKTKTIKRAKTGKEYIEYGIEIIEKRYTKKKPEEENNIKEDITVSEEKINKMLNNMLINEVTPVTLEYVARDMLIENDIDKFNG